MSVEGSFDMNKWFALTWMVTAAIAAAADDSNAASLIGQSPTGAWQCTVTITSPNPLPPFLPANYPGAINFFSDGNVVAQANGDGPAAISHGVWLRTGDRTFRSTWVGFDQDGSLKYLGAYKVFYNFRLEPDLNALSGVYRLDLYDAAGKQVVFSFGGASTCTRVLVENFEDTPPAANH
jgi:hypothetical protein